MTGRGLLRAVDSTIRCNAEFRAGRTILAVCELPARHEGKHKAGCTRW